MRTVSPHWACIEGPPSSEVGGRRLEDNTRDVGLDKRLSTNHGSLASFALAVLAIDERRGNLQPPPSLHSTTTPAKIHRAKRLTFKAGCDERAASTS